MPYTSKKEDGKITVSKKGGGVVGHTTPEKYNDYMAALHMHEPKGYEEGGVVTPNNPQTPPPTDPITSLQADASQVTGTTPDKRAQLYSYLQQQKQGMGPQVGESLANVGQAIARGYGRDQGADYLNKTIENQNATTDKALDFADTQRQQGIQNYQIGKDVSAEKLKMDPNSAVSNIYKQGLEHMGMKVPPGMSAHDIETVFPQTIEMFKAKAELALKEAELAGLSGFRNAQVSNERSGRLADINSRIATLKGPLGLGIGHGDEIKSLEAERDRLTGGSVGGNAPSNPGTATHRWNPQTGKVEAI